MKIKVQFLGLLLPMTLLFNRIPEDIKWKSEKFPGYQVYYTAADSADIRDYNELIRNGISHVSSFFRSSYKTGFNVFIHPDRHSLDSTWQKAWNMLAYKSECWMVASGVGSGIDLISPKRWKEVACEHDYNETSKTQQLITHELVHVFHGQWNVSPDFSTTEGLDWFVEGLATYASGQCDSVRMAEVRNAVSANQVPQSLDDFWSGRLRYGLSGSVVMFLDHKYGRPRLMELLSFNKKTDILGNLNITESELLHEWILYVLN